MKFVISRSSTEARNLKPCEEAKEEVLHKLLVLGGDFTKEDFLPCLKGKENDFEFLRIEISKGDVLHYEEAGETCSVFAEKQPEKAWTINVESLDDLLTLHNKYGTIILLSSSYKECTLALEIYDSYRE